MHAVAANSRSKVSCASSNRTWTPWRASSSARTMPSTTANHTTVKGLDGMDAARCGLPHIARDLLRKSVAGHLGQTPCESRRSGASLGARPRRASKSARPPSLTTMSVSRRSACMRRVAIWIRVRSSVASATSSRRSSGWVRLFQTPRQDRLGPSGVRAQLGPIQEGHERVGIEGYFRTTSFHVPVCREP